MVKYVAKGHLQKSTAKAKVAAKSNAKVKTLVTIFMYILASALSVSCKFSLPYLYTSANGQINEKNHSLMMIWL